MSAHANQHQFNTEDKRLYLKLLKERARRDSLNQIATLFPDEGEYRRQLYPKHMEFFRQGAVHKERLFMAGNRCITPWTHIETAAGSRPALEVFFGLAGNPLALLDGSECEIAPVQAHLKGIEPAFRVLMDNGQVFDCSRKHRVLTTEGYLSFDQLVSLSSGLHCSYRLEDYQANCAAGGYLCGQPPHLQSGNGPASLQPPGDAQKYDLLFSRADAESRISRYSHAYQEIAPHSTPELFRQIEALCELFSAAKLMSGDLCMTRTHREYQRLAAELGAGLRSDGEPLHQSISYDALGGRQGSLSHVVEGRTVAQFSENQDFQLSDTSARLDQSVSIYPGNDQRLGILHTYKTPELVGGRTIVCIVPLGYQPIIDAHIPRANNYKSAGVYHHNCGKTVAGGFELALHLTGDYPHWWEGRRFTKPVDALAAGVTGGLTRDTIQKKMLGKFGQEGTGIIPGRKILRLTRAMGVSDAFEEVKVQHSTGGVSSLWLRSYAQGREVFQGFEQDVIWMDEEVPTEVYEEAVVRTMTTNGIMMMTYTPLKGQTELTLRFLEMAE